MLSIRVRLALWYALVLLGGLVALAPLASISLRQLLLADIDASLKKWAKGAETVLTNEATTLPLDRVRDEIQEYSSTLPEGSTLRVQDYQNRDFFNTDSSTASEFPAIPQNPSDTPLVYSSISLHGLQYRLLTYRISIAGKPYQMQLATSLGTVNALVIRFRTILLWASPLVLLIASLGGLWISSRALAPVDAMTYEARAISIQNLSQRLRVPRTHDELQRLCQTWNEMLDRLEAALTRLSQFTADASHELRSPIALIRTTTEIALSQQRSPDQYRAALDQVMTASLRMSKLVEDLLELARADAGRNFLPFAELDLRSTAEEIHGRMLSSAAERSLVFLLQVPDVPAPVLGNDAALRRLLIILLDNAIKFTPAGGRIELTVERLASRVVVRVADTGIGMPAAVLPHIFERFYRADLSRGPSEGAGLGLSIAQAIARAHAATIDVTSDPGAGSVFCAQFPVANSLTT